MAANISVPMNFGIRLLDSPTHSTLELKARDGKVVKASSVILSYNSPVIDHMTTTLHLTSVDMEEFSEEAVRYFVDAAYSGKSPPISKDLFRDINKMANVFEMSWLVTRCVEHFTDTAEAIEEPSYQEMAFLFDEGAYIQSKLKSRDLVEIALTKIRSINGEQDFISRYLENLASLSFQQLDLIIELTGINVEYVVKPLTEQLTADTSKKGTLELANFKYVLENMDLNHCRKLYIELYEELFDVLEELCSTRDDFKWLLGLQRKSSREVVTAMNYASTSADVVQYPSRNVLPNIFHNTLDCSLTFDEVVDWLGKSDDCRNLFMFMGGLLTWFKANKGSNVKCSSDFLDKFREIKTQRKWETNRLYFQHIFLNDIYISRAIQRFFDTIWDYQYYEARLYKDGEQRVCGPTCAFMTDVPSIFEKETKLLFTNSYIANCSQPGQCGFILKTVPAKDGPNFVLCTDPTDYSDDIDIHYHYEIEPADIHLAFIREELWPNPEPDGSEISVYGDFSCFPDVILDSSIPLRLDSRCIPLSWADRPVYSNGKVSWDLSSHDYENDDHGSTSIICYHLIKCYMQSHKQKSPVIYNLQLGELVNREPYPQRLPLKKKERPLVAIRNKTIV